MDLFGFVLVVLGHLSSVLPLHVDDWARQMLGYFNNTISSHNGTTSFNCISMTLTKRYQINVNNQGDESCIDDDAIIVQIQRWGVVGAQHVTEQVLLNGISLSSPTWEVHNIIKSMSTSDLLPFGTSNNQTYSALKNHTILRSRECIMEGSRLHWTDRVFCDGKVFLTLEQNNTWTAHAQEAVALKKLWDQETEHSKMKRSCLQEGCIQLMKELKLSEELSVQEIPLPRFLIPILAVTAFFILIIATFLFSRGPGRRNPGGVIGSIIHYPKDITYIAPEKECCYTAL